MKKLIEVNTLYTNFKDITVVSVKKEFDTDTYRIEKGDKLFVRFDETTETLQFNEWAQISNSLLTEPIHKLYNTFPKEILSDIDNYIEILNDDTATVRQFNAYISKTRQEQHTAADDFSKKSLINRLCCSIYDGCEDVEALVLITAILSISAISCAVDMFTRNVTIAIIIGAALLCMTSIIAILSVIIGGKADKIRRDKTKYMSLENWLKTQNKNEDGDKQ